MSRSLLFPMTEEPQTPQQGSDSHHENTSAMMAAYCVLRSRFCAGEEAPGFFSSSGNRRFSLARVVVHTTTNDAIKNGYSGTTAYDIPSPLTFAKFLVWTPLKQHLSNTNVKCHYKKK
ncbi:hypothetical protein E3N88_28733 [Mikania micrantha]|uniref:Uncharacterized protein n=1 Tax=Mikania micrantha TaxID=192012 RepID=A0A5N6N384_9ASTR|nr:hypothetical protein E3N88_28733 [Mikania micrantha]